MSITESLSTFPEVFGEHYTLARAQDVFSNMRDRCPKEYEEKKLSIRQAAELLSVDHKTLHQRIRARFLKPKKERADNKYVTRMLVSMRDLADMIIAKPLKACSGNPARRYTQKEILELKTTGKVSGRTYNSYKVKAHRLGLKLREIKRDYSIILPVARANSSSMAASTP
jgi:hypothetical protein